MKLRTAADIGLTIREKRRALGWDQQTLADRVGVSRLWVGEMEKGKRSVRLDLVLRTLAALDIDLHAGKIVLNESDGIKSASAARIAALLSQI